jgi:1,5-anhydro-D-fructose reductase (1,5-anhydro-D-mannitol-forming)
MIKWGVIGAGGIARRRTIPEGIIPAGNSELAAVMSRTEDVIREIGEQFGARAYTREDDLLKDPDVEAIYIATPVHVHAAQVIAAAQHKKHVLVEKPMALTVADCEKMIQVCRENDVKLGIGYMMRFHAHHQTFREMVRNGALGKPVLGRAQLSCWYPPIEGAWRQNPQFGGGGSLIDMGSHCIDVLEFIFHSRVEEVSCFTGNVIHGYPVEDSALMTATFSNGALGVVDAFFSIPDNSSKNALEIYGSGGSILAKGTIGQSPTGEALAYLEEEARGYQAQQERKPGEGKSIEVEPINTYKAEIEEFADAIIENRDPIVPGEDGLWNQKIILAAYESARTGKVIEV